MPAEDRLGESPGSSPGSDRPASSPSTRHALAGDVDRWAQRAWDEHQALEASWPNPLQTTKTFWQEGLEILQGLISEFYELSNDLELFARAHDARLLDLAREMYKACTKAKVGVLAARSALEDRGGASQQSVLYQKALDQLVDLSRRAKGAAVRIRGV